jgi:hypothetical protein
LPWSAMTAGRGMADQDASNRLQPPLVCCIRLFYSAVRIPTTSSSAILGQGQIVRPIHAAALAYATREGVARRALLSPPGRQGCDAPKTRRAATRCLLGRHGIAPQPTLRKVGRGTKSPRCTCSPRPGSIPQSATPSHGWGRLSLCVGSPNRRAVSTPGATSSSLSTPRGVEHRG